MEKVPVEGEDYYFNEEGLLVMTAEYLRKRGSCCGNGCRHCPFDYINVPAEKRAVLLLKRQQANKTGGE